VLILNPELTLFGTVIKKIVLYSIAYESVEEVIAG
jgi:hypothetical protein